MILGGDNPTKSIQRYKNERPVWFVYSGIGSQFLTMGKDLLNIEIFKKTFDRCASALKPYGIDLHEIVTSKDPKTFNPLMNRLVGVLAIQIGLSEVLRAFGIEPEGYSGHSSGESSK